MPETTPLIKAALNLRVGAGFDVYDCTGHRRDGIKKNRTYISNFKTVAKQLSSSRELYLRRGIFLCYNQVQDFMWSGNRTDRAFTQFDELGVTEWKQQH